MQKALGDFSPSKRSFSDLSAVFEPFHRKEFQALIDHKKSDAINQALFKLIQNEPEPCFLLSAVLEFIERVDQEKLIPHYNFNSFELWLNHSSGLSFEENYRVRGKVMGKWIERSDYQVLFPIGTGKVYEGPHFVTAHKSPDLDTTIASFWGWVDAFAARVGDGLHMWNLPGGPPSSQIEIDIAFRDVFGAAIFTHLPKTRTALTVSGHELVSKKGFHLTELHELLSAVDIDRDQKAVVLVDSEGFYLGDWRSFDVEEVRQVILLMSSCLRWFENNLHLQLISLFARQVLQFSNIEALMQELFGQTIASCEPASSFSQEQRSQIQFFLKRILKLDAGLNATFEELRAALEGLHVSHLPPISDLFSHMKEEGLFDREGKLVDERPRIFHFLERSVRSLHESLLAIRNRLETFDIALGIKQKVFGRMPTFVTVRAEIEEIRAKMGDYSHLTVAHPDGDRFYPVGVVLASDVRKPTLGTVSLRDFCNREEMGIPSFLEVISVIDHHKSSLDTFSPPLAVIRDAQSCNTLVAERSFMINDRYSLGGRSAEAIAEEMTSTQNPRLLKRLLTRRLASEQKGPFYIHPDREFLEYLHFLYGILDDTDLLSKVTSSDVECVVELLNRMKSIAQGKEAEVLSLDDLPRDRQYAKKAAARILQTEEMYSIYRKIYEYREKEVERNLERAAKGQPTNIFADTKEQNGCCRVGQTKVFASNIPFFERHAEEVRKIWLETAQAAYNVRGEVDLHLHMISTIVSAEEVYKGQTESYSHRDEMWVWIPEKESAYEHLKRFLNGFQASPGLKGSELEVEFFGPNGAELASLFRESFPAMVQKVRKPSDARLPIAVIRYKAGALNSRKAMVTPFLPSLS